MKKIFIVLSVLFLISFNSVKGQTPYCSQLIEYVYKNGTSKNAIDNGLQIKSEWLKKVEAFSIENKIVVIAEMYSDDSHFSTKKYIYCDVPPFNWDSFYNTRMFIGKSLGENFHKYIDEYKCNCN
jgi:hypothetical protein